ncbi:MAG TPA: sigma-70 family RNA polymerase sigma factor [Candidatus Hydrogenedentes bacterium]|nr:sigma-70 family RNA polymerase sigma factor [Candidatus Hydrogenedentota bacterium]
MNPEPSTHAEWVRDALTRHEGALVRYAMRFTGDIETARDVAQDTFLRLCDADRDQIGDYLAPWLYRVCRNRALDVMKKERRMQLLEKGQAERRAAPGPTPEAAAANTETGAAVIAAMATLPENQQEVFRLKFQDQLSYREISDVTGFPVNNVRYLIHTALQTMREQLRDRLELAGAVR